MRISSLQFGQGKASERKLPGGTSPPQTGHLQIVMLPTQWHRLALIYASLWRNAITAIKTGRKEFLTLGGAHVAPLRCVRFDAEAPDPQTALQTRPERLGHPRSSS